MFNLENNKPIKLYLTRKYFFVAGAKLKLLVLKFAYSQKYSIIGSI